MHLSKSMKCWTFAYCSGNSLSPYILRGSRRLGLCELKLAKEVGGSRWGDADPSPGSALPCWLIRPLVKLAIA